MIHSTAVIHAKAEVDSSVEVGPYAVVDGRAVIGPHCRIGPHVHLTGDLLIGEANQFHSGCVIGDAPQDLRYQGDPTRVRIGDRNVFREHVTVHRASSLAQDTVIGSDNFFMAHCHVGHNGRLGSHIILANGVLLGGYAEIDDRAFVSGNCLVHQFARIGTLAFMQGGAGISKDLPPFTMARGQNHICGLNTVGMRRAGVPAAARLELRAVYHLLFRSQLRLVEALEKARQRFSSEYARTLIDFVASAKRGVCSDIGVSSSPVSVGSDEKEPSEAPS